MARLLNHPPLSFFGWLHHRDHDVTDELVYFKADESQFITTGFPGPLLLPAWQAELLADAGLGEIVPEGPPPAPPERWEVPQVLTKAFSRPPDPLTACAYCGRRYLWSTYPLRIEATCVDCWPNLGWPARFTFRQPKETP